MRQSAETSPIPDQTHGYFLICNMSMLKFKVITVGKSVGFILNREAKLRLNVQKGDTLILTEAPNGALRITPYTPDFKRQMALAESVMHNDREILRALVPAAHDIGGAIIPSTSRT